MNMISVDLAKPGSDKTVIGLFTKVNNQLINMTTKELTRQWRMLDTAYDRILKQVRDLAMQKEAEDNIADILSAQKLLHRQEIAGGKVKFGAASADDLPNIANAVNGKEA